MEPNPQLDGGSLRPGEAGKDLPRASPGVKRPTLQLRALQNTLGSLPSEHCLPLGPLQFPALARGWAEPLSDVGWGWVSSSRPGAGLLISLSVPDTVLRVGGECWMAPAWHRVSVGLQAAGKKG